MNGLEIYVIARVLLASVFVGLGIERFLTAFGVIGDGSSASAGGLAFAAFELVVGLMVLVGWQTKWAALLLAAFLLVDAFISHQFWRVSGAEQHGQLLHFLKNIATIGGFVLLFWAESLRQAGQLPR